MISQPVLWIDPGKDTGLALWWHRLAMCDEFGFQAAGNRIYSLCSQYGASLLVGWEHFTIGPGTHKKTADAHHAIEMIGVARYWAQAWGCQILQPAQPGQRLVATRAMCEAIGWWPAGKDDAQSACQHLLAWMMRTNNLPGEEAGILAGLRQNPG